MAERNFAVSKTPDSAGLAISGGARHGLTYAVSQIAVGESSGAGDLTPPTITNITPTPGEIPGLTRKQRIETPLQFDVTDLHAGAAGLRKVAIWAKVSSHPETRLVYDGAALIWPFSGGQSSVAAIAGGLRFSIRPVDGWTGDIETLTVVAIDAAGNEDV